MSNATTPSPTHPRLCRVDSHLDSDLQCPLRGAGADMAEVDLEILVLLLPGLTFKA
jgi:hypothetical protein